MAAQNSIIVIGAGIIGISIALELQSRGMVVRVVDRAGVACGASRASAGAFAFSDIVPLATPGIMRKAPGWLLDPLGPLSIPPTYALKIAPWMLRFWRSSWRDKYEASLKAQVQLMTLCQAALERQIANVAGEPLMQRDGQLQLFEGRAAFNASQEGWDVRRRYGINFDLLESPESIAEIQPGLDRRFTHAGFTPDWMNTVDPKTWAEHLATAFTKRGGRIDNAAVQHIAYEDGAPVLTTETGETHRASALVVAAGAWSHRLAHTLGDKIPLETERGYNTTLPAGAFDLRTHLTFGTHGFVVSRINGGVRVGGAVELGGLDLPPNFRRADILLEKAKKFLPGLNTENGAQWMGFRPSMPDSLPVIGPSPRAARIFYAFGHGHLGLTQAAGTAELVGAMIAGPKLDQSVNAFSPARF